MNLRVHSLSIRFLLFFFVLVILPVFLFIILVNHSYSKYQGSMMELQLQETLEQMAVNLDEEIAAVSILSSALSHNAEFLKVCDGYDAAVESMEVYNLYEEMDRQLSNLFLYTNKTGLIFVYTRNKPPYPFGNFPLKSSLRNLPEPRAGLLESLDGDAGMIRFSGDFFALYDVGTPHQDRFPPLMTMVIQPNERGAGYSVIRLLFAYKLKLLEQIYRDNSLRQFAFLTDEEGHILLEPLSHGRAGELWDSFKKGDIDRSRWMLLSEDIPSSGWHLHLVADLHAFMEPFNRIRQFSFLILLGIIISFVIYTILFFQSMISPLNMLSEKMSRVESGDYNVRVPESGESEIRQLLQSFNRMIAQVKDLTEFKFRQDRERAQLEFQALQYQINPHFVANTLNAIRLMAVVKKNENIKNMTTSLMQLVNNSFRGEGNRTTLREEIDSLSSYIHIMKVRFSNPVELRFSVDDELKDMPLLRMLLQPIVENAVVHGLAEKRSKGIIQVQVNQNTDRVGGRSTLIRITDNGKGMELPEDSLPTRPVNRASGGFTGIGIRNVDRRIRLNYGEEYGLTVKSRRGHFTTVEIRLPYGEKHGTEEEL